MANREIIWRPTEAFAAATNVRRFMGKHGIGSYDELIARSNADVAWFWDAALSDLGASWFRPYDRVMDDSQGIAWTRWFLGGRTNLALNGLDRHVAGGRGEHAAFVWEGDGGDTATWTYARLSAEASRVAGLLTDLGVSKGDAVGFYLPMIPELVAALFGCWKVGAVPVPVFSGFASDALATRLDDCGAKVLFTADGALRRGTRVPLKPQAELALQKAPSVRHAIVVKRTGDAVPMREGRDLWWHEAVAARAPEFPTASLEAEARALIIYTSGTTGRPKGTVHTHAGLLAQLSKEVGYYFDVKPDDRFFWLTDIGWMMGPWEIIGVSFFGATFLLFEGAPNWPKPDRLWSLVERHGLTHLGISPTAVRVLAREGDGWLEGHDLSSLRLLGSTGETWDPESYEWLFRKVGGGRCPILNISGGTEICGCLLSPLPITELKACTLRGPGLAMDVDVFDDAGQPVRGAVGHLVCKKPAPSMTKGFLNDPQRYLDTYFSRWPDVWYHGDWAYVDEDGFWFLHGRADDTIKVAGKRTGPAEIEGALIEHAAVSEAAAIGVPDDLKGEAVVCFVVLAPGHTEDEALRDALCEQVVRSLGKTLRPKELRFVDALPKTRSSKIVRGAIKKRWLGQPLGDVSTVENPDAIEAVARAR